MTAPSPSARLRTAATRLRELSERVPPEPWWPMEVRHRRADKGEWIVDSPKRLIAGNIGISGDPWAKPIAEWIAALNPLVGTALADWLDIEADDEDPCHASTPADCYVRTCRTHAALKVADALLAATGGAS